MITTINEFRKMWESVNIDIQYSFKKLDNDNDSEWDYNLELYDNDNLIGIITFWRDTRFYPDYLRVGDANIYIDEYRGIGIYQNALRKAREIAIGMGLKGVVSEWVSRNDIATKAWNKIKNKKNIDNDFYLESNNVNETFDQKAYLKWKRQNVTIRGMKEIGQMNGGMAVLGSGLYTAPLSNKSLTKCYGTTHFVLNAIPKNPKTFNTLNDWEIWFYNTLVFNYSKALGKTFPDKRDFNAKTTIETEIQKMGYDGVLIKGREMVCYKPENVMYFSNERQLQDYYEFHFSNNNI